ncbi:MAG: ribonuclease H-like domain-containing protein [Polyangiaceae bacterium]
MRSLRQKLADLPSAGFGLRKEPVRTTSGADEATRIAETTRIVETTRAGETTRVVESTLVVETESAQEHADVRRAGPTSAAPAAKPSLEELRARIAALVGHRDPPRPRPDPSAGELPFVVERTATGPRYVRRIRTAPAGRVGRAPLIAARDADPVTLGLLALDPAISKCDPRRALYLDTETTGLAGGTGTVAFLVGLAFFDEAHQAFVCEQMLLRRLGEEAPILELLEKRLADASMIVTYNGKSFDVPLLRARFVMNRMTRPAEPPHLDLLHVARRVHKHRLSTCTLASIESEVLGRERVGDVSGMDIVEAYMHFLRSGDDGALHGVVTHNEHDVLSMVALLGIYGEPFESEEEVAEEAPARLGTLLSAADLAGAAQTLHRAGAMDRARALAGHAVRTGGGVVARRVSADILRARGEIAEALRQYEAILDEEPDPEVRLVLAKLYEHHERAYDRALSVLTGGTTETEEATLRRQARLERKRIAAATPRAPRAPRARKART